MSSQEDFEKASHSQQKVLFVVTLTKLNFMLAKMVFQSCSKRLEIKIDLYPEVDNNNNNLLMILTIILTIINLVMHKQVYNQVIHQLHRHYLKLAYM